MRKEVSVIRVVLAFIAALLVAGPGLMVATAIEPTYKTPVAVAIIGPSTISDGSCQTYSFKVKFTDSTVSPATVGATVEGGTLTFSKVSGPGTVSGNSVCTLGPSDLCVASANVIRVNATYTNASGSATVNRNLTVTGCDL